MVIVDYGEFGKSFWNGLHSQIYIALLIVIVIDTILGVANGAVAKRLNSSIGIKGLARKSALVIIPPLLYPMADSMHLIDIYSSFLTGFIVFEGLSVVENCDLLGIPLPTQVTKYLMERKVK